MSWGKRVHPRKRAKLRLVVLARDGYVCQLRYPGICTYMAQEADHIHPAMTHGDGIDNLQAACRACNIHKGEPAPKDPPARRPHGAWWG